MGARARVRVRVMVSLSRSGTRKQVIGRRVAANGWQQMGGDIDATMLQIPPPPLSLSLSPSVPVGCAALVAPVPLQQRRMRQGPPVLLARPCQCLLLGGLRQRLAAVVGGRL